MDNNKLGTKPHYQILDGLRGVAAGYVIGYSYSSCMGAYRGYADRLYDFTLTAFHGYTRLAGNASALNKQHYDRVPTNLTASIDLSAFDKKVASDLH